MSALYPRGDLYKLTRAYAPKLESFPTPFLLVLFPLGQGPPNVPSLSWAGCTKDHRLCVRAGP